MRGRAGENVRARNQRERDEARTQWLAERGFRVLRFSDREALMQTEAVLAEIQNRL